MSFENKKTLFVEVDVNNNSYYYNEYHYDIHFPIHYATNHLSGTGPNNCNSCKKSGTWRGVFIGYCVFCARNDYNFTRGNGFYSNGLEVQEGGNSAFDTYLKDVSLADIGNYTNGDPLHLLDNNKKPIMLNNNYLINITNYIDIRRFVLDCGYNYNCLDKNLTKALTTGDFRSFCVNEKDYEDTEENEDNDEYYDLPDLIPFDNSVCFIDYNQLGYTILKNQYPYDK
jgi:hypothetical protein